MIVVRELQQISTHTPAQWRGRVGEHGSIHIALPLGRADGQRFGNQFRPI